MGDVAASAAPLGDVGTSQPACLPLAPRNPICPVFRTEDKANTQIATQVATWVLARSSLFPSHVKRARNATAFASRLEVARVLLLSASHDAKTAGHDLGGICWKPWAVRKA